MYEPELQAVLFGFDFLRNLYENDYRNDPTFDKEDLRAKMQEIDNDVVNLFSQLPFDTIGNLAEERDEMPDDTMQEGDMEDEVVECESAINATLDLLNKVSIKYLGETYKGNSKAIYGGKASDEAIKNIMDRVSSYFPEEHNTNAKKKHHWTIDEILAILLLIILFASAIFN